VTVGANTYDVTAPAGGDTAVMKEAPVNVDHDDYDGDIAAAVAVAASAPKGRVYIPSAQRALTAAIAVSAAGSEGLEIFGDGERSELTMANVASRVGFDVSANKVTIRDLKVKGSTGGGAGAESHAIRYQENANHGKVIDVWITNAGDDGVHFAGCIAPQVIRPHILDCGGNGITAEDATTRTNFLVVQGGWVQSCAGNGVYVGRCESPVIEGVALELNGTTSGGSGNLYMFETLYPVVRANYFEDGEDFDLRYNDVAGFAVDGSIVDNTFQASSAPTAAPKNIWLEAAYRCYVERNKFSSVLSGTTNLEAGTNTFGLRLGAHNFPGTVTLPAAATANTGGYVIPGNLPVPSVASAATITLPGFPFVTVTGTTTITTIVAGSPGQRVTLKFTSTAQVTDGSNLELAGNLTGAANRTLSLVCDGTSWIETGRSAN
jgi:hypothetical protein